MIGKVSLLKIVFLPGMDGSGELFGPLLTLLADIEYTIIKLPHTGEQDYETLTNYVKSYLPDENYVLIAESFSGPIAARICSENPANLKAVIFAASFLSTPSKLLLPFARQLPLKLMSKLPLSEFVIKKLLLGDNASIEMINQFRSVLKQLPSKTLQLRIKSLQSLERPIGNIDIPALYLFPTNDRLVSKAKSDEFSQLFSNLIIKEIDGTHFIFQSNPKDSADALLDFYHQIAQ